MWKGSKSYSARRPITKLWFSLNTRTLTVNYKNKKEYLSKYVSIITRRLTVRHPLPKRDRGKSLERYQSRG
nr:MAG TPA: hypothetical protein [Caudoviricetes sp.]